jgi:hypothetical protein
LHTLGRPLERITKGDGVCFVRHYEELFYEPRLLE